MLPSLFGLRSPGFFLGFIGGLPLHLWVFWKVIKIIYKEVPKKVRFHMEQHKTKHIYGVEIHNSEPTI
jgi:hypothetical protein